jgi:hypothetical protein
MAALFILFVVLLAFAAVLAVLNHRDMPGQRLAHRSAHSRTWWPGSRRPR